MRLKIEMNILNAIIMRNKNCMKIVTQPQLTLKSIAKFINDVFADKFLHHNEAKDIDFS